MENPTGPSVWSLSVNHFQMKWGPIFLLSGREMGALCASLLFTSPVFWRVSHGGQALLTKGAKTSSPPPAHPLDKTSRGGWFYLSRREMGGCCRRPAAPHPRRRPLPTPCGSTSGPTPTQCGTRARSWLSGMPCWPSPTKPAQRTAKPTPKGVGGVKSRPARADGPARYWQLWASVHR